MVARFVRLLVFPWTDSLCLEIEIIGRTNVGEYYYSLISSKSHGLHSFYITIFLRTALNSRE